MKHITVFCLLVLSILTLKAQDTTNTFEGEWQVDEFKIVIGAQTIYVYQRDSLEKCQNLLLETLGTIDAFGTEPDTLAILEEVNSTFDMYNTLRYIFISDTVYSINGVNRPYKLNLKKQWIMLDPSNLEAGWSAYKKNEDQSIELWQGMLGGMQITTLKKK